MYSRVPLHKVRYVTFGEVWGCTKRPPRSTKGTFFSEPIPVKELPSYSRIASFSTPEMASSKPLHKLLVGEARASSQSSTKRAPRHQPPSQLGGHPPRVTSSRSLTRTNRGGELKHYARMQSKNTKGVQILLSQIPPKQQMLRRN
jgi:hypothetical protein